MFTGLIEETGTILDIFALPTGKRFVIKADKVLSDVAIGDSICVNGACQTVEKFTPEEFTIFSIPETLAITNLRSLQKKSIVNLERALPLNARIGGHLVQGHVENTAKVLDIQEDTTGYNIIIKYDSPYIFYKGSVTVDGISLTIMQAQEGWFRVQIIPETLEKTNIKSWYKGYEVNIETDFLVKALDNAESWRNRKKENSI